MGTEVAEGFVNLSVGGLAGSGAASCNVTLGALLERWLARTRHSEALVAHGEQCHVGGCHLAGQSAVDSASTRISRC